MCKFHTSRWPMRLLLPQITAAIMETRTLIDQSKDRAAVVLIRLLQAVEPTIVEESLRDDVFHPLIIGFSRY